VESMSIGEVARWAGVRPSTLRYYELRRAAAAAGEDERAQALRRRGAPRGAR
jgi:MerR HTH family regulatory protein